MACRALIIAIEDYANTISLAQRLPGTHDTAARFRDWLITRKNVNPNSILACAGPACSWRTRGTSRIDIIRTIADLTAPSQSSTTELYFFFSGHGFLWKNPTSDELPEDVLVSSDFVDLESAITSTSSMHAVM